MNAFSDACPAANAEFGNSNGLSVAVDGAGNLYLDDGNSTSSQELIRKIDAQGFAPLTLTTAQQQIFEAHFFSATSAISSTLLSATTDMTAGSPACTLNADHTLDCTVAVTSTPSATGLRTATLTVANGSAATDLNIALDGTVSGSALAFDNASTTANNVTTPVAPTTISLLSGIVPAAVAVDGAGNAYAASGTSILESVSDTASTLSTASSTAIALPATPTEIAVDPLGNVYAVNPVVPSIDELAIVAAGSPGAYELTAIPYTPCSGCTAAPQAVATDAAGNVYVADQQSSAANTSIYRLSAADGGGRQQSMVASGLANPVSLAVDPAGNVYVADKGAGAVYKLAPTTTGEYSQTTALSSVIPVAVAFDAAGDLYVQDEASATVIEVPVSGGDTTVVSGLQNPVGVAVDGLGNVYSADAKNTSITQVIRNAGSYGSSTSALTAIAGTLTNVGNLAATGLAQTEAGAYTFTTTGCSITATSTIAAGQACQVSAALSTASLANPGTVYTDALSFLAAPSIGFVTFNDIVPAGPTSTSVTGPVSVLFNSSGTEATFTIAVTGIASPAGSPVSVAVSAIATSGNSVVYSATQALNASGQATVSLSGLAAGNYAIAANYAGVPNTYSPSSASAPFTIQQFVATGDTRTVTEPSFPAVCTVLSADLAMVNNDIPASVDATVTNPDGARIQAALNGCAGLQRGGRAFSRQRGQQCIPERPALDALKRHSTSRSRCGAVLLAQRAGLR